MAPIRPKGTIIYTTLHLTPDVEAKVEEFRRNSRLRTRQAAVEWLVVFALKTITIVNKTHDQILAEKREREERT